MDALQAMLTNIKTTEPSAVGSPLPAQRPAWASDAIGGNQAALDADQVGRLRERESWLSMKEKPSWRAQSVSTSARRTRASP